MGVVGCVSCNIRWTSTSSGPKSISGVGQVGVGTGLEAAGGGNLESGLEKEGVGP
jgi:hypothetical protein